MSLNNRFSRRNVLASAAFLAVTALSAGAMPQLAYAYDEQSASIVNVDSQGVALKGYDPVSYFSASGPVAGKSTFSATYGGATYWFANAANRETFKKHPARYEPAYGGFCAMGVALEKKLDVDPQAWRVVDSQESASVDQPEPSQYWASLLSRMRFSSNWNMAGWMSVA